MEKQELTGWASPESMEGAPAPRPCDFAPPDPGSLDGPLNRRQERFCYAFVQTANAAEAAEDAGYSWRARRQQGWRLLRDPRIRDRIAEIQAELAREKCHARDALLGKLEMVYLKAIESGNLPAAARAVALQAKLAGIDAAPARARRREVAAVPTGNAATLDGAPGGAAVAGGGESDGM